MAEEAALAALQQQYDHRISSFPAASRGSVMPLRNYRGCWLPELFLPAALAFSDRYDPHYADIFLVSPPKSGTTWLKALAFAAVTRERHDPRSPDHPLLTKHPQDIVPMVEKLPIKLNLPSPRIMSTHMAYQVLPESVTGSRCRIVYVCREPKDSVVSAWHFFNAMAPPRRGRGEAVPFEEAVEAFCEGTSPWGPMWEHWLGYWRESLRRPDKVLFLRYEEMKGDAAGSLRRLAGFLGCAFSEEEEGGGVPEGIVSLCSFEKLKGNEEINRGERGLKGFVLMNSSFFRKGEVGDWKNYFTVEMARKVDGIVEEKLHGSGLSFGTGTQK